MAVNQGTPSDSATPPHKHELSMISKSSSAHRADGTRMILYVPTVSKQQLVPVVANLVRRRGNRQAVQRKLEA